MTVVFVAGWSLRRDVWQPLLQALQLSTDVLCLDMAACSPQADTETTLQHFWQTHSAELPDNATYIGWSLGGLAVLHWARHMPARVKRCALLYSSPFFAELAPHWPGLPVNGLQQYQQLCQRAPKRLQSLFLKQHCADRDCRQMATTYLLDAEKHALVLQAGLRCLATHDEREYWASLAMPCHVRLGQQDCLLPASLGAAALASAPNSHVVTAVDEHHFSVLSPTPALVSWCREVCDE